MNLPPLPPTKWKWVELPNNLLRIMAGKSAYPTEGFYDSEQMREYATHAVLAERERCAEAAESCFRADPDDAEMIAKKIRKG